MRAKLVQILHIIKRANNLLARFYVILKSIKDCRVQITILLPANVFLPLSENGNM
jgi:hypothetical protein